MSKVALHEVGDFPETTSDRTGEHFTASALSVTDIESSNELAGQARLRLLALADTLAEFREKYSPRQSTNASTGGTSLRTSAFRKLVRLSLRRKASPSEHASTEAFLWNAPLDVTWAHQHAQFDQVLHVFHQEWHGIRAASGYLPGNKVAISAEAYLTQAALRSLSARVAQASPSAVLFHGWSPNAARVARAIRESVSVSTPLIAVWHGNTAQFMNPFEIEVVGQMLRLHKAGVLDSLVGVKPDSHLLSEAFQQKPLLNLPPRVSVPVSIPRATSSALIPVPNDWRKNYFTNLYAAAAAGVERIFVTTPLPRNFPLKIKASVHEIDRPSREELFSLLPGMGIVMNCSLSECQPMTALEALAFGVPSITPKLELGELDRHPYQELAQVAAVDTLGPVQRATKALIEMRRQRPKELREMMSDYAACLQKAAFERMGEVLL